MIAAGLFVSDSNSVNPLPEAEVAQSRATNSNGGSGVNLSFFPLVIPASQEVSVVNEADQQSRAPPNPLHPLPISHNHGDRDASSNNTSTPNQGSPFSYELPGYSDLRSRSDATSSLLSETRRFTVDDLHHFLNTHSAPLPASRDIVSAGSTSSRPDVIMAHHDGNAHAQLTPASVIASSSIPGSSSGPSRSAASSRPSVNRVCRDCAFEVFLHELYMWWGRERGRILGLADPSTSEAISIPGADQSFAFDDDGDESDDGFQESGGGRGAQNSVRLPAWVGTRKDCEEGRHCTRQRDNGVLG